MVNASSKFVLSILLLFFRILATCQDGEIHLQNPSFESFIIQDDRVNILHNWYNVELQKVFPIKTPEILHLSNDERYGVSKKAFHGENFIGLEVRENRTWGSIGQTLDEYLDTSSCYIFSVQITRSYDYNNTFGIKKNPRDYSFDTPIILRIWGVDDFGNSELLAISDPIENYEWENYEFRFHPKRENIYMIFEAFPSGENYDFSNGHLLLDNFSSITYSKCDKKRGSILRRNAIEKNRYSSDYHKNINYIKKTATKLEFSKNKITEKVNEKLKRFIFYF